MSVASGAAGTMPAWRIWLLAARPHTLPAAVAPVLVGTAAAVGYGHDGVEADLRVGGFVAALIAALFIQVATNFANDLADFQRGADHVGRLGPMRATHAGLVSVGQMRAAAALAFAAAAALGVYLIVLAGWPILAVGLASIVAGYAYTGGPWPYGYHGLGDAFVFVFFGVIAVMGSYFVQAERVTAEAAAAAIPVGATVTAILVINNLRDADTDRISGKRTLAVILGRRAARLEYVGLLSLAYLALPTFAGADLLPWWALLPLATLPLGALLARAALSGVEGRPLNAVLKRTGQLHLLLGGLLALAYLL